MAATGAGERRRADLGDDRGDHPAAGRRALPRRRRVRGDPAVSRPPLRAARAPRPPRALGGGDRAAGGAGADRARAGGAAGRVRDRRRAAADRAHPRRAPDPAHRAASGAGRRRAPGHRHLLAQRDPDRRQVALLRGQHAGDADRPGPRRRRGGAGAARRHRARGAHLDDLLGLAGGRGCGRPRSASGILESITRAQIVRSLHVEEGEFPVEDLLGAREAFLASTVREVQPVAAIDDRQLETPGPRTLGGRAGVQASRWSRRSERRSRPPRLRPWTSTSATSSA